MENSNSIDTLYKLDSTKKIYSIVPTKTVANLDGIKSVFLKREEN